MILALLAVLHFRGTTAAHGLLNSTCELRTIWVNILLSWCCSGHGRHGTWLHESAVRTVWDRMTAVPHRAGNIAIVDVLYVLYGLFAN